LNVLVLSDIHGNLEALQAVLEEASAYSWKEIWFLGDLTGYGPDPDGCYNLLSSYPLIMISGNHDLYLAGKLSRDYFSGEALRALILTRSFLSIPLQQRLELLPPRNERKRISLVHGSPENPSREYILSESDALRNFSGFRGDCCLFGHSHLQEYYLLTRKELEWKRPEPGETVSWKRSRILINPGSVGQPRDRDPRAAWCLLDTGKKTAVFYRTPYNYALTQEKMRNRGFSDFLINRLAEGI